MPQNYKPLGQILTTSNTITNVYVTDTGKSAVINSIYITNQDTSNANVDIIIRPISEALANKHFYLFNQEVKAADTVILNLGITMNSAVILAANNKYRNGEGASANVSVNAFGLEIT